LVATFQAQGLLDDRAAARLWAEHWARQHYADSAIRLKLLAKGFDEPLARNTIARLTCDADDEERARRLLAQHLRRSSSRSVPSRLARLLASRGFDSELIERVLRISRNLAASDSVNAER
jgi:SOS response regulatory protein OraA/RecX